MTKIKRNDPCPCGSGKKFKQCHSDKSSISQTQLVNQELDRWHGEFVSAMMSEYADEVDMMVEKNQLTAAADDETTEIYQTGLALSIPFHVPSFQEDNRTIHADFIWNNSYRMSTPGQELFKAWADSTPTAYTILDIDADNHLLNIQSCYNQKQYYVPFHPEEDFSEARVLIGSLVPYADQYGFFFTIIKLYERDPEDMASLVALYQRKQGGLQQNFPGFLADTLLSWQNDHKWNRPIHQEVAQQFANRMSQTNQSDSALFKGISLWQTFTEKVDPAPRKAEPFAAALEYLIVHDVFQDAHITQNQLANAYDCKAASISVNYRKLVDELDI